MNKIKNSKKGFTLVELVVVIAILAILAAIAIPVVASTIKSSQVSSSQSNAQTIELAIKEAQAAIASGDNSVFANAATGTIKVSEVASAKKISTALDEKYTIDGKVYECVWSSDTSKVYFANKDAAGKYFSTDGVELKGTITPLKSNTKESVTTLK